MHDQVHPRLEVAPPQLHVIEWDGYSRFGAGGDPLAHYNPPESVVDPVWREGFLLNITNPVPTSLHVLSRDAPNAMLAVAFVP